MEQLVCPVCGGRVSTDVVTSVAKCLFCKNEFLVQSSKKLGDLDELMCQRLSNLRTMQTKAADSNDIGVLLSSSKDILKIVLDDYLSSYYFAYASNAKGSNNYIKQFYSQDVPSVTNGDITTIVSHITQYSDLRDRVAVERYIMSIYCEGVDSFALLGQYKGTFATRKSLEENYDIVQRDVFVCHRSTDRAVVEGVVSALERDGHKCWVSYRNLRPNDTDNYWDNISAAIEHSTLFLVVCSSDCMLSSDCKSELNIAKSMNKARLEYKIDNEPHTTMFKSFFDGVQWVDGTCNPERALATLCHRVYAELDNIARGNSKSSGIDELKQMIASQQSATVAASSGVNIPNLIKSAKMHLEEGCFDKAQETLERIADADIECAEMYWLRLLVSNKACNDSAMADSIGDLTKDANYTKAIRFASAQQKKHWQAISDKICANKEEHNRKQAEESERQRTAKAAEDKKKQERDKTTYISRLMLNIALALCILTFIISIATTSNGYNHGWIIAVSVLAIAVFAYMRYDVHNKIKPSKIAAIVLMAINLACYIVLIVDAAEVSSGGAFSYTKVDGGYSISASKTSSGVVEIPSTYNGEAVVAISNYGFANCDMSGVVVPSSVKSIGKGAFEGCDSLKSLTVPFVGDSIGGSYEHIGYIFGCTYSSSQENYVPTSLKTVVITGGNIGDNAFEDCESIVNITLPSNTSSIGHEAFSGCSSLVEITIPSSVTLIESWAFYRCSSLKSITIPSSVTLIESGAFSWCDSLENVIFEKTSGWNISSSSSLTNSESVTVTNSATNATRLSTDNDYRTKYWWNIS